MTKMKWDNFIVKHPNSPAFVTKAENLPKQMPPYDINQKKTPTFYGILQEWANKNLSGDWTSHKTSSVIILRIATAEDQTKLLARFPPPNGTTEKATSFAEKTIQFGYTSYDYGCLAAGLGYKFTQ